MKITLGTHYLEIEITPLHALIGPEPWDIRSAVRAIVPPPGPLTAATAFYASRWSEISRVMSSARIPSYLVLEEFGADIYPTKVQEVMGMLREMSSKLPVLLTTNNPLVINEMQPEEVTLMARDADHSILVRRLDKTKNFAERSKVYSLGELWLSYVDGKHETELMGEDTR